MKYNLKKVFVSLIIFFLIGLILSFLVYQCTKKEIIHNNQIIVSNILKSHPELEQEIIVSLTNIDNNIPDSVLAKYGLDSLDSLEYLDSFKNYRYTFFLSFFLFYTVLSLFILLFFWGFQRRRK